MKFVCDQCNTKYSIADERVRGRILKIRCKTCDHVISVREPGGDPELPGIGDGGSEHTVVGGFALGTGGFSEALFEQRAEPVPAGPVEDWYVSFDGEQEGPYTVERARERVKAERRNGKEIHVWRAEFFVWLAVEEVPEFALALRPERPERPEPKPRQPIKTPPVPMAAVAPAQSSRATGGRRSTGSSAVVASGVTASAVNKRELEPDALEPRVDTKPVALPPPPELMTATPLLLPLTSAPAVPLPDNVGNGHTPGEGVAGQMTKPEPRLSRRALAEVEAKEADPKPAAAPSKEGSGVKSLKEIKEKKEAKKAEEQLKDVRNDKKEKSAPVPKTDLVAAPAHRASGAPSGANPPLDTSPIPLPPPPGGETPIVEPSELSRLPDPKVRRKNPFADPSLDGVAASSVPVVVVNQAASSSKLLKGFVVVLLVIVIGMSIAFVHVMRAGSSTTVVVENKPPTPSTSSGQHVTEEPIALPDDPVKVITPTAAHPDAKKPNAPLAKKGAVVPGKLAAHTTATGGNGLSSDQKNLAALYNDDGDKSTPHTPGTDNGRASTQVSQQSILAVVTQNRRSLNTCYDRVLKHDATLKRARVVTHVAIGISGSVLRVTIPDPAYADSEIGQCLAQSIKHWHFPAGDAEYETEFPILLQAE